MNLEGIKIQTVQLVIWNVKDFSHELFRIIASYKW